MEKCGYQASGKRALNPVCDQPDTGEHRQANITPLLHGKGDAGNLQPLCSTKRRVWFCQAGTALSLQGIVTEPLGSA